MSEQRRTPREVPNTDNLATRLAKWATVYIKYVESFPTPVSERFHEGHRCSARDARVLSWALVDRGASVANSNLTRGSNKDASDADKVAYLTKYLNEDYTFTADLGGSVFGSNVLELAADRLLFDLGTAQGKVKVSYKEFKKAGKNSEKRAAQVAKILTDPALADKYESMMNATIAAIFAERPAPGTRKSKTDDDDEGIEV